MKWLGPVAVVSAAVLTFACEGVDRDNERALEHGGPVAESRGDLGEPGALGTSGTLQRQEHAGAPGDARQFARDIAETNMAEIQLAELAIERSQNGKVKAYAQMLKRDHQQASEQLKQAVRGTDVQWPTELNAKHRQLQEKLRGLRGEAFDREFIGAMVTGHQEATRKVEQQARMGHSEPMPRASDERAQPRATGTTGRPAGGDLDHAVSQWASKTLPTLKKHLQEAEQIQSNLGGDGAKRR